MSNILKYAEELRAREDVHYNCVQAVLVPFAKELGLSEEVAFNISRNFGAGMKMASVCGAITGGLMVLGLYGIDDPATINGYYRNFRLNHDHMMNCGDLLRANMEKGGEKKPHCDGMVYEAIKYVEEILKEKGKM